MNHAITANGRQESQLANDTRDLRKHARVVGKDLTQLGKLGRRTAKNAASTYLARGKAKAREFGDSAIGYVQENPVKSVLIATATGVILGAIWARRR